MSNNADEFACIACVACVDSLKVKGKGKMVNGCCEGLRSKGYCWYKCIVDISVCWYKCMLDYDMPADP